MSLRVVLPLLLLGAPEHAARVLAQSVGAFAPTGNMTTPRLLHTATLLTNGKVLITGGRTANIDAAVTASTELYDPSTGSFAATGAMITPRVLHTATLLPDGKVLIAGGYTPAANRYGIGRLASAELYDPSAGTFTPTGSMITTHSCHSATLLGNGKVLITGDSQDVIGHSAAAELYDPATGKFATTGIHADPSGDSPLCPWAALLPDGGVLIASGCESAELYHPGDGTFSVTGRASSLCGINVNNFAATVLMNGKVLAAGGGDIQPFNKAQLYDRARGVFTATGDMTRGRFILTATLLLDGTVLIAGDATGELYDPANGTFRIVGNMTGAADNFSTATLLADGSVLIAGGGSIFSGSGVSSGAQLYRPQVLVPAPVLFSVSGDQGAILHAGTNRLVSASDPAATGEALEIYGAGLIEGGVIPPQVAIGGRLAEVLFFGKAPGFAALNQINVRVPSGVMPGSAVPVRLTYVSRPSNEVIIGVQ